MFAIYASVGLAGYLTYGWLKGQEVDVLISTNMAKDSNGIVKLDLPGELGGSMSLESTCMTLAVIVKSFCSISPVCAVCADLPELLLLGEQPSSGSDDAPSRKARRCAVRTLLLWVAAAAAYASMNELALVEAVTGSLCSMLASISLPCACWVALYRHELTPFEAVAASALAVLAAVAGAAFTVYDIMSL